MVIIFVEALNKRKQNVMGKYLLCKMLQFLDHCLGFLDLRDRSNKVFSPLDLTTQWLTPTRDDLTYFNFNTNTSHSTATKVCNDV